MLIAAAPGAFGQTIYDTLFEPDTFLEDIALEGQDGWIAAPP